MMQYATGEATRLDVFVPASRWHVPRLIQCIRFDEVIVLQGAPFFGALFALHDFSLRTLGTGILLAAVSVLLVAHVFVLNDWSGIEGDTRDPHRAPRTFATRGVTSRAMAGLAAGLLVAGLALASMLGLAAFLVAVGIVCASALYSLPNLHMKGMPLCSSLLHLSGGALHFLLGYAAFSSIDARGLAIGSFFAVIFSAGHLIHEARDFEGDALSGIRTNAVAFGRRRNFFASLMLFTLGYALLAGLAIFNLIPSVLLCCCAFYPLHLWSCRRALDSGLSFQSLRQHQSRYRLHFAAIGVAIVVVTVLSKLQA